MNFRRDWPLLSLQYLVCGAVALVVALPLVNTVLGGLKSTGQLMTRPFGLPNPAHADNYVRVLQTPSFWTQLFNSTVVTGLTVIMVLGAASMAAFVFARMSFRGR